MSTPNPVGTFHGEASAARGRRPRARRPMAIMVPDSCPSRATPGEKRLYRLLQDLLPDNFTVWYEPVVRGRYPDFTILADTFGLLVLEVKGWYPKQISKASDQD